MHLRVLACDLDGTLAEHGEVAAETWEALARARAAGLAIILVTGRILQTFAPNGPYADLCDAIVAEDGAVVYFPERDRVVLPFGRLPPELVERLDMSSIPLERGMVIVATHEPYDQIVLEVLRGIGGGATVEYNRGAVMVLPAGATKGAGLLYALRELGYSPHNVVACGDAENDRSLFAVAELAVAVANAVPPIRAIADVILPEPDGAGVRFLIGELCAGRTLPASPRPDRRLLLGRTPAGSAVHIAPATLLDGNIGIVGASGSGKSWVAGLLAEELLKQGYQLCVIDPEGDYRGLRAYPHTLLVGGQGTRLPPVAELVTLCEYSDVSLVLDLSTHPLAERNAYVAELLRALRGLRARRGRPHWFLADEIQSLCPCHNGEVTAMLETMLPDGGWCFVSYRPSQVSPLLLAMLNGWILTRLSAPAELAALAQLLGSEAAWSVIEPHLPQLPTGQAYLLLDTVREGSDQPGTSKDSPVIFRPGPRTVPHIRHLHKYLWAPLPDGQRFYFRDAAGGEHGQAASLWEFREALARLPGDVLQYHLSRGDFSRWVRDTLHDSELADRLARISRRGMAGEELRQALVSVVVDRFDELDNLI
ncbi:MAG: DUF5752 family protein [Chloroflexota bacterium]